MKTTNAKAKVFQTPAGPAPEKELEKTQPKPQTSARRPKKLIHADAVKLEIHGDESLQREMLNTALRNRKTSHTNRKTSQTTVSIIIILSQAT
jgi:hypothetical protein